MKVKTKNKIAKHIYKTDTGSNIDSYDFMTMKVEDKRRILKKQADQMADYYSKDSEWKEFLDFDITND